MDRQKLLAAIAVASALGIGSLVLQRWVAETRGVAIALVIIWFVVVALVAVYATKSRPEFRGPVLGTLAAVTLATVAVGYWTGFRDTEVDEDVVVAAAAPSEAEAGKERGSKKPAKPQGPIKVAEGSFVGVDGHAGTGIATVVEEPSGIRQLTFTEFDIDPGPGVVVWLTRDAEQLDDRVELGSLKGNVGNQQYELPANADLAKYDTVVLYCTPFTVRMAVAELSD